MRSLKALTRTSVRKIGSTLKKKLKRQPSIDSAAEMRASLDAKLAVLREQERFGAHHLVSTDDDVDDIASSLWDDDLFGPGENIVLTSHPIQTVAYVRKAA